MSFPLYIIDAFIRDDRPFTGNPAAVCVMEYDDNISDDIKQKIASEMNLSETAFVAKAWNKGSNVEQNCYTLRWFTPTKEVDLCGHATLATAAVVFERYLKDCGNGFNEIKFETKFKGCLKAIINGSEDTITLDFPLNECIPVDRASNVWTEEIIKHSLGPILDSNLITDIEYSKDTRKLLLRLIDRPESEKLIYKIRPNFEQLLKVDSNGLVKGVIVTQKAERVHFLSRYFTPWNGINEDPVTGAAHTVLTPYWKRQYKESGIQTKELIGEQCSERGGTLVCSIFGERVRLKGKTRAFVSGIIRI